MELTPGTRLGRYLIEEPLGHGSEGRVFNARQYNDADPDGTPCVVKIAKDVDAEGRRRFLDEARRAMQLGDCINIVPVIDAVVADGIPCFVMPYSDGVDLRRLLAYHREATGKPPPLALIFPILKGIADGLHHAHVHQKVNGKPLAIIHRDVKPANTFVNVKGVTKLLDFGISTRVDDHQSGRHLFGTYRYMSPEHVQNNVCPAMDIYSLGIIAWEMLAGKPFYDEQKGKAIIPQLVAGTPPPPLERADAPSELKTLVERSLNFDPMERPSARDFSTSLATCPGAIFDAFFVADIVVEALGRDPRSRRSRYDIPVYLGYGGNASPARPPRLDDDDAPTIARPNRQTPAASPTVVLDDAPTRRREPEPDAPRMLRKPLARPIVNLGHSVSSEASDHRVRPRVSTPAPPTEPSPGAVGRGETVELPPPPRLNPPRRPLSLPSFSLAKLLITAFASILLGGGAAWWLIEGGPW